MNRIRWQHQFKSMAKHSGYCIELFAAIDEEQVADLDQQIT